MRRSRSVFATCLFLFGLGLMALFVTAGSAHAANCYEQNGVYLCDARPEEVAFETPGLRPNSIFFNRTYAWMEDYAPFYDAPGGEVVEEASEGILYYTIEESVADGAGNTWYRVDDRWAKAENMHVYGESQYAGVEVLAQPERPFGWILQKVQPAPAPDAEAPADAPYLTRYTFVELYGAAEGSEGWVWYDIGGGRWIQQTFLGLVSPSPRPEDVGPREFWVEVDLYEQTVAAYEGDRMVYATLVSTGLPRFETNEGLFTTYTHYREWPMWGGDVGDDYYYLQDVPHTMFVDDEIALHGAYWHDNFGYKQSHGCVNMPVRAAEWVFYWMEDGPNEDLWVWVHTSDKRDILNQFTPAATVVGAN